MRAASAVALASILAVSIAPSVSSATPASDALPIIEAGGHLYAVTGPADAELPPHWRMVSLRGGRAPNDEGRAETGTLILHVGARRALGRRERVTIASQGGVCVASVREEVVLALGEQRDDRILVHDRHLFRALQVSGCEAEASGPSVARVGRHDAHVEGPDAGGGFVIAWSDGSLRVREADGVFALRDESGAEVVRSTPIALAD